MDLFTHVLVAYLVSFIAFGPQAPLYIAAGPSPADCRTRTSCSSRSPGAIHCSATTGSPTPWSE